MIGRRLHHLWLALPALLVCLADQFATLTGQSTEYWAGDWMRAHEGSPQGLWLLQQHPLAYIGGAAGYMLAFTIAILLLPRLLAQTLAVGLVLGHAWGTSSWLFVMWPDDHARGYYFVLGFYTLCAILVVGAIEMSRRKGG